MNAQDGIDLIQRISQTISAHRERLDQLDAELGDGDHGTSLSVAFEEAAAQVKDSPTLSAVLQTTASILMNRMGGSSGALYGSMFLKAALATKDKATFTPADASTISQLALDAVVQRGKGQPGGKTMIDALAPAVTALQEALNSGADFTSALEKAAQAAETGAASTADMTAQYGRAKFVGERGLGHIDAGAASVALIFEAILQVWRDKNAKTRA